jgi:hypothetical protein
LIRRKHNPNPPPTIKATLSLTTVELTAGWHKAQHELQSFLRDGAHKQKIHDVRASYQKDGNSKKQTKWFGVTPRIHLTLIAGLCPNADSHRLQRA